MSEGGTLPGFAAPAKRLPGRPKGSTNKRARDLKGFIDAKYGASAAQQSAALCMVTPAELRAAGGSMAKARVSKALDLVAHVRRAQDGLDEGLREVVRQAVRDLGDELPQGTAEAVRLFIHRVKEAGAGFGLREALKLIGDELADLLPYTDQRQPLAIEAKGAGIGPSVVMQVSMAAPQAMPADTEMVEVFGPATGQVAPLKSHDDSQDAEFIALPPPSAAD